MTDAAISSANEIRAQDLATLVAGLNRFLMRLSNMPAFHEAGLGLAEWSALSLIAERSGINNRQLANVMGVSPQRINQITDSLKGAALIAVASSAEDARKKVISITPAGMARLRELNVKLQHKLAAALDKRPAVLVRTNGLINKTLMRIVLPPKQDNLMRRRDAKGRAVIG